MGFEVAPAAEGQGEGMTLEQAVEVLNRECHRYRGDWCVFMSNTVSPVSDRGVLLFEFEAVAVAEKYERERIEAMWREPNTSTVIQYGVRPL